MPAPDPAGPAPTGPVAAAPPDTRTPPPDPATDRLLPLDDDARGWVDSVLLSLDDRALAAQLVVPWMWGRYVPEGSDEWARLRAWVEDVGVGGIITSIGPPVALADKLNRLQRLADVPLLVSTDMEAGPGMRLEGGTLLPYGLDMGSGTAFPPLMALGAAGDPSLAYGMGRVTAAEARAVGIHLDFAPVVDVNNNPANPIINTRSYGGDPAAVASLAVAQIRGLQDHGMLATAKHFPGHGDVERDTHLVPLILRIDAARADSVELAPYRSAVRAGVSAIMSAHIAFPALSGDSDLPATLSPRMLDSLLVGELGFDGLVVTDALNMGAIVERFGAGQAAVLALEAGADVLLQPVDPAVTVDAVVAAVDAGRLSRARLERSVRKILEAKARVGLHRRRTVDVDRVAAVVGRPEHRALADTVAERAITLVRDREGLVPLRPGRRVLLVSYTAATDPFAGRVLAGVLRDDFAVEHVALGPGDPDPPALDALVRRARSADAVVVAIEARVRAGSGAGAVPDRLADAILALDARHPLVLVALGNPYILQQLPDVGTYLLGWSGAPVSQAAVGRAVAGRASITGTLPIAIPPLHERGEGLVRPAAGTVAGKPAEAAEPAGESVEAAEPAGEPVDEPAVEPEPEADAPLGVEALEGEPQIGAEPPIGVEPPVGEDAPAGQPVSPAAAGVAGPGPRPSDLAAAPLDSVARVITRAIGAGVTPGAVVAVGRSRGAPWVRSFGRTGWEADAPAVVDSTIYDLASLTKVVGTTSAVMLLVDDGRIDLDAPLSRYLPAWPAGGWRDRVTVRRLLTHSAGLAPFVRFWHPSEGALRGSDAVIAAIAALPREYEPGTRTVYSDLGAMLLGAAVEAVAGVPLDAFLEQRLWAPLGMADTGFRPVDGRDLAPRETGGDRAAGLDRIAPTEVDTVFRNTHVHGVVHDENAFAMGGVAGHAGLFSTAPDLSRFAGMLLRLGRADGRRLIDPATVTRFTARQPESERALGWDAAEGTGIADPFSPSAFGHTGFTGTSLWVDPARDLYVVLLTNRVNPTRAQRGIGGLRRAVHEWAVRAADLQ